MLKHFVRNHQWLEMKTIDNETPFKIAERYYHLDILNKLHPDLSSSTHQKFPEHTRADIYLGSDNVNTSSHKKQNDIPLRFLVSSQQHAADELINERGVQRILTGRNNSPNCDEDNGLTPLMVAVKYRRLEDVKQLLEENDNLAKEMFKKRDFYFNQTVLHI